MSDLKFEIKNLNAWFGDNHAVRDVSIGIESQNITAVIGPSGCGKSTFLRCLNRMHELVPGARAKGSVILDGEDIYGFGVDPVMIRRRVGMVFQKPNPFPTMSVYDNVIAGIKLLGRRRRTEWDEIVETSLRQAALWDEVSDKLKQPGTSLSGGQQQRLCIARALSVRPDVLLLDEPASALDPISTGKIEELLRVLSKNYTIIIVTHNMQQAARVSDRTAFFLMGEVIEYDETRKIFTNPTDQRTEDYITGRFG